MALDFNKNHEFLRKLQKTCLLALFFGGIIKIDLFGKKKIFFKYFFAISRHTIMWAFFNLLNFALFFKIYASFLRIFFSIGIYFLYDFATRFRLPNKIIQILGLLKGLTLFFKIIVTFLQKITQLSALQWKSDRESFASCIHSTHSVH